MPERAAVRRNTKSITGKREDIMKKESIRIEGMTCNHCVMAVRRQLAGVEGVEVEDVAIGSAVVRYDDTVVGSDRIDAAIAEAGFRVTAHE
jgi:copper chaperone